MADASKVDNFAPDESPTLPSFVEDVTGATHDYAKFPTMTNTERQTPKTYFKVTRRCFAYSWGNSRIDNDRIFQRKLFFGDLPYVPLARIFDYLTVGEKLNSASVSKAWLKYVKESFRLCSEFSLRRLRPGAKVIWVDDNSLKRLFLGIS